MVQWLPNVLCPESRSLATRPQPYTEIFSFQARAWPHRNPDLIPARWRWMFVDSAHRLGVDPRVWLYRDQGRIVGYMGSIAVRVKLGDEERQTGWLVDTMVLEEYRNQGVGPRLMVGAHEDQPFSLSLGQTVEMREIQFRLGWKRVVPLQVARLLIRPEKCSKEDCPRRPHGLLVWPSALHMPHANLWQNAHRSMCNPSNASMSGTTGSGRGLLET